MHQSWDLDHLIFYKFHFRGQSQFFISMTSSWETTISISLNSVDFGKNHQTFVCQGDTFLQDKRHIILLWKYKNIEKMKKKNLKKFLPQGGFELTTIRLEGERRTPELKFYSKNLGKN